MPCVLSIERERALKVRLQSGPILAVLGIALCVCPLAGAQRGSQAPAAHSTSSTVGSSHASGTQGTNASRANVRASAEPGFAHSAQRQVIGSAVNRHKPFPIPNLPSRTPIRTTGFYLFYGGMPYWVSPDSEEATDQEPVEQADAEQSSGEQSIDHPRQSQSQRSSAVIGEQTSDSQAGQENSETRRGATEPEAPAPLPDEGEFTLVMTDGTWIQAVAFTHFNDKIVYITAAGSRYTIPASDLDSDSTLRVNQERGTPLQSPL